MVTSAHDDHGNPGHGRKTFGATSGRFIIMAVLCINASLPAALGLYAWIEVKSRRHMFHVGHLRITVPPELKPVDTDAARQLWAAAQTKSRALLHEYDPKSVPAITPIDFRAWRRDHDACVLLVAWPKPPRSSRMVIDERRREIATRLEWLKAMKKVDDVRIAVIDVSGQQAILSEIQIAGTQPTSMKQLLVSAKCGEGSEWEIDMIGQDAERACNWNTVVSSIGLANK